MLILISSTANDEYYLIFKNGVKDNEISKLNDIQMLETYYRSIGATVLVK